MNKWHKLYLVAVFLLAAAGAFLLMLDWLAHHIASDMAR